MAPKIIQIVTNKSRTLNYEKKHEEDAKLGWYRYDSKFALTVLGENGSVERPGWKKCKQFGGSFY